MAPPAAALRILLALAAARTPSAPCVCPPGSTGCTLADLQPSADDPSSAAADDCQPDAAGRLGRGVLVQGQAALQQLDLRGLTAVEGELEVASNPALASLDLADLANTAGALRVHDNPLLSVAGTSLALPVEIERPLPAAARPRHRRTTNATGARRVSSCTCPPDASSCTLAQLENTDGPDEECRPDAGGAVLLPIVVEFNFALETLDLSGLVSTTRSVTVCGNPRLCSVDLSDLERVEEFVQIRDNTGLAALSLGSLASVGEYLSLQTNIALPSLALPALVSTGDFLQIRTNIALSSLDLSALISTGSGDLVVVLNGELSITDTSVDVPVELDLESFPPARGVPALKTEDSTAFRLGFTAFSEHAPGGPQVRGASGDTAYPDPVPTIDTLIELNGGVDGAGQLALSPDLRTLAYCSFCDSCASPLGSTGAWVLNTTTVRLRLNGLGPPFLDRFATVSDRFSGSWCRFLESWWQDGEDGEKTGKKRRKMGEKWPKESGSNDGLTANAE